MAEESVSAPEPRTLFGGRLPVSAWGFARWLGDLVALVVLAGAFAWLALHDGGFSIYGLTRMGWLALLGSPVAIVEAAKLPRIVRGLVASWGVGALLALLLATERSDFVRDSLILAIVPIVALLAVRIWRRPWGPAALLVLLLVGFGRYWYDSFLTWWGDTLWGRSPMLRPLSWRNPSGMLMGAFGLFFLGLAVAGRRLLAIAGVLLAAAGLGGAWLSGSRGAVIATAIGFAAVIIVSLRHHGLRRIVVRTASVAGTVTVIVAVLVGMVAPGDVGAEGGGGTSQPVLSRTDEGLGNLTQRFRHMEAALGMFVDQPLTGHGPGSYRARGVDFARPDAQLTSSAHNEFLESLAEEGVLFAIAFWGLHVLALVLVWRYWRRGSHEAAEESPVDDLRTPLAVGAVGVIIALGLHTAIDIDWRYPVIPALFVVAMVALAGRLDVGLRPVTGWWSRMTAIPLVVLLCLAVGGRFAETRANVDQTDLSAEQYARSAVPWNGPANRDVAMTLSTDGQQELAATVLDRTIRWNPGVAEYRALRAIVGYRAGNVTAAEVVAAVDFRGGRFFAGNTAAAALIEDEDYAYAEEVLADLLADYPRYARWGVGRSHAETWFLAVTLAARTDGCDAAKEQASDAVAVGAVPADASDRYFAAALGPDCHQAP